MEATKTIESPITPNSTGALGTFFIGTGAGSWDLASPEGSNPKEYVLKGNGIDEQDIDIAFACYGQKNSHYLYPSVGFSRPQYPYIFRKRQQVKVAYQDYMGGKINPDLYMRNVVWKGTTMRVISANYSADYEQTTLTLQET